MLEALLGRGELVSTGPADADALLNTKDPQLRK
jgi:hypothetical protein